MATHSSTLAWESHGWRSLAGYSPQGHKELDATERLQFSFSFLLNQIQLVFPPAGIDFFH